MKLRRGDLSVRPINPAEARAEVIAALEAVDLVVVFEEDTPLELIKRVRPAVLVKGGLHARGGRRWRRRRSGGRDGGTGRTRARSLDDGDRAPLGRIRIVIGAARCCSHDSARSFPTPRRKGFRYRNPGVRTSAGIAPC